MSARSQCTCEDCAADFGHISQVTADVEEVFILHTQTNAAEAAGLYAGDVCELDHNHSASKSCGVQYKCECGEIHEYMSDAEECCVKWECNFCGYVHSGSAWSWGGSAKANAAECCAQTCDECGAYGWPDFIEEHSCNNGMGLRQMLPWERRGIVVNAYSPANGREWKDVWGFEPEQLDVVQAAADFYLLEAMQAGIVGTTDGKGNVVLAGVNESTTFRIIRNEAAEMFSALVDKWDPILQAYTHMACGGELRHHVAVGGAVLNGDRDTAWSGWKIIFDTVGPDALQDAADLFMEFSGGAFGGEPWADACKILHARVTGKIAPRLFLDRIFNAQHNGGVLLNKVTWEGEIARYTTGKYRWTINELQSRLLPAHGVEPEPDYPTLLAYASSKVQMLFSDCFEFAGHAAKELGISLATRRTKPGVGDTVQTEYARRQAKLIAQQAAYNKMPESEKLKVKADKCLDLVKSYAPYAAEEAKQNARIEAQIESGKKQLGCECGMPGCEMPWKQSYYTNYVRQYQKKADKLMAEAHEWAKYEAGLGPKPGVKAPVWVEFES